MQITWQRIEEHFKKDGLNQSAVNALRTLFNSPHYQHYLIFEKGIITDRTYAQVMHETESVDNNALAQSNDLAAMDVYDLADFIESNAITNQQARSITGEQMRDLTPEIVDKIIDALSCEDDVVEQFSFVDTMLVQTGFPHSEIKGPQIYERVNGNQRITFSGTNEIKLPYGLYARLIFLWLCTTYKKTGERKITMPKSLRQFIEDDMGKSYSTGKRGTAVGWRQQLISICATSITETVGALEHDTSKESISIRNIPITESSTFWWDNADKENDFIEAHIVLSPQMAESLDRQAMPLLTTVIGELAATNKSPLAIDLYCWLNYRYFKMEQSNTSIVPIPWNALYNQLGTNAGTLKKFREMFRVALVAVSKVYPQANFDESSGEVFKLFRSPPHVTSTLRTKLK